MRHPGRDVRPLTLEEYLDLEEVGLVRHEYVDGEIYAMRGETRRHDRLALNVAARLLAAARGGPCRVSIEGVKLRVGDDVVYYPDVMVAAGRAPSDPRMETAPCLVVEVLSPATWRTDRREKAIVYRGIPTLGAYLVVDQERRLVERHWRDGAGAWRRETLEERGTIALPCPASVALTLDEIYEDVELPPLDEVLRVRQADAAYA
jgi:Uma2 family endonuclease